MAVPRKAAEAVNSPGRGSLPPWDLVCKCRDHWLFAATGADLSLRKSPDAFAFQKCAAAFAAEKIGLTEQEVRNIAERERWADEADLILGKFSDRNHGAILRALARAFTVAVKGLGKVERDIETDAESMRFCATALNGYLDAILKISGRPTANVEHNLSGLSEEQLQARIAEIKREIANAA